eukprot:scaffold2808_cov255-Pinguiococcus_pyrenoidosus.AAC.29
MAQKRADRPDSDRATGLKVRFPAGVPAREAAPRKPGGRPETRSSVAEGFGICDGINGRRRPKP